MKTLEILENLISFKTINQDEVTKAFEYIKDLCKEKLYVKEYVFNGYKSIIISNKITDNYDICFLTHIDVVPAKEYKMKIIDDKVFGRGAIDMKGQVAVILDLMLNNQTDKSIGLVITSDEEQGGFNGIGILSKMLNMDFAIVPDGGKNFSLIIEEKGVLNLKLSINGKSAHASQPWNGINAINLLIEKLNMIMEKYPLPKNESDYVTSINISKIKGGEVLNKIPNYAECELNIRHTIEDSKESIIKYIESLGFKTEIISQGEAYVANLESEYVKNYINIVNSIIKEEVKFIKCESASDARFLKCPSVIMNPTGDFPHSNDEFVTLDGLKKLYQIYKEVIK